MKPTTINNYRTEYIPQNMDVNVHEHKAPTDKSIKLLNEMQEKAIQNIIASVNTVQNKLNASVIYFQRSIGVTAIDEVRVFFKFNLNGTDYSFETFVDRRELFLSEPSFGGYGNEKIMRWAFDKISKVIAVELLKSNPDIAKSFSM